MNNQIKLCLLLLLSCSAIAMESGDQGKEREEEVTREEEKKWE